MWFLDEREDIVAKYAPWALDYITEWATVEAVACRCEGGALRMCDPNGSGFDMRHWVGARPCDGAWPFGPDAFKDEGDKGLFTH